MDSLNWDAAKVLFDVGQAVFLGAVTAYVWWINKTRATSKAINAVSDRVEEVDRHVSRLEQQLSNQPGPSDIEHLRHELSQTNRGLTEVSAQLHATSQLLNRLHDYLLNEKRGTNG